MATDEFGGVKFVGWMIFGFGIFLAACGAISRWTQLERNSWKSTTGTIIESKVKTTLTQHDSKTEYGAGVVYTYSADGRLFKNNRISETERYYDDEAPAREHLLDFPVGEKVTVYFNPKHPSHSILDCTPDPYTPWVIVFGVVISLPGLWLLIVLRRSERPASA